MPQSVEGVLAPGYIAPNSLLWDVDVRSQIFDRYREDTLHNFLIHSDRKKETKQTKYNTAEFDYLFSLWEIESVVGTPSDAAGEPVTVILKDANHEEAGKQSWPLVGDNILIGTVRGRIMAVDKSTDNAHQVTMRPVNAADNIVAVAIADAKVSTYGDSHADGSGQPEGRQRKPIWFYNYTQIIKTHKNFFGSESANKTETVHDGKNYYYLQGVVDGANEHNMKVQMTLLLGERGDTLDDGGYPVYSTRGVDKYIENYGNGEPYTTAFGMTDLRNVVRTLDNERAPTMNMIMAAVDLNMDIDDAIGDKLQNTSVNYAKMGIGDERAAKVDFGFNGFRYGNYEFMKMKFDAYNYQPITGYTGSPWPGIGYVIPLQKLRNADPNVTGEGSYQDSICLRYKANDRENRFEKHWTRDQTITNKDQFESNHQSELGLEMVGVNQMVKIYAS